MGYLILALLLAWRPLCNDLAHWILIAVVVVIANSFYFPQIDKVICGKTETIIAYIMVDVGLVLLMLKVIGHI